MKKNILIVLAFFALLFSLNANEMITASLGYTGFLTDKEGLPLDGEHDITFTIYADSAVWTEVHRITVKKGEFIVDLGTKSTLDFDMTEKHYLGIKVGTDPEMTPRIPLLPVSNVMQAEDVKDRDINPNSVSANYILVNKIDTDVLNINQVTLNHKVLIDKTGAFKGILKENDPTVPAAITDGVQWTELTDIPADIADGDEVGIMQESDPTVPANLKDGLDWTDITGIPGALVDGLIDWTELTGIPADIADGDDGITVESDPSLPANLKNGADWTDINGIPSDIADGDQLGLTEENDPTVPDTVKDGISWDEITNKPVPANRKPLITTIVANPVIARSLQEITLTALVTDPDNDNLTYSWYVASGELLTNNMNVVTWKAPQKGGSYNCILTVNDGTASVIGSISIYVQETEPTIKRVTSEGEPTDKRFSSVLQAHGFVYFNNHTAGAPVNIYDGKKITTLPVNTSNSEEVKYFNWPILFNDVVYFADRNKLYKIANFEVVDIDFENASDYVEMYEYPIIYNQMLYFWGWGTNGPGLYYVKDNTIKKLTGASIPELHNVSAPTIHNGELYFVASTEFEGHTSLFRTDGTNLIQYTYNNAPLTAEHKLVIMDGTIFISGMQNSTSNIYYVEGDTLVKTGKTGSDYQQYFINPIVYNGNIYFGGISPDYKGKIYRVDKEGLHNFDENYFSMPFVLKGFLYYGRIDRDESMNRLIRTDGTSRVVIDLGFTPYIFRKANYLNDDLVIMNMETHSAVTPRMFKYDGTTFSLVKSEAGMDFASTNNYFMYQDRLYFTAYNTSNGLYATYYIEQ